MDRGAWQAIVHGVVKSRTQLSDLSTAHVNSQVSIHVWGKLDIKCVYVTYLHLFPTFFIEKAFERDAPITVDAHLSLYLGFQTPLFIKKK